MRRVGDYMQLGTQKEEAGSSDGKVVLEVVRVDFSLYSASGWVDVKRYVSCSDLGVICSILGVFILLF